MEQVSISRGHHSGVSRAIDAHRELNEARQSRQTSKDFSVMAASQPSTQYVVANQVAPQDQSAQQTQPSEEEQNKYNNPMLDVPTSMSKTASVWAFQNSEPGKPMTGDPIPKGSYLDVRG